MKGKYLGFIKWEKNTKLIYPLFECVCVHESSVQRSAVSQTPGPAAPGPHNQNQNLWGCAKQFAFPSCAECLTTFQG